MDLAKSFEVPEKSLIIEVQNEEVIYREALSGKSGLLLRQQIGHNLDYGFYLDSNGQEYSFHAIFRFISGYSDQESLSIRNIFEEHSPLINNEHEAMVRGMFGTPLCVQMSPSGAFLAISTGIHHDSKKGSELSPLDLSRDFVTFSNSLSDCLEMSRTVIEPQLSSSAPEHLVIVPGISLLGPLVEFEVSSKT